jgi:hypothetical protein
VVLLFFGRCQVINHARLNEGKDNIRKGRAASTTIFSVTAEPFSTEVAKLPLFACLVTSRVRHEIPFSVKQQHAAMSFIQYSL